MARQSGLRRRSSLVWVGVIVAVIGLLVVLMLIPLARAGPGNPRQGLLGRPAPELNADDLAGRAVSLTDGRGRLVWVNFWATWCPPCTSEMPAMQALADAYEGELLILGVNAGEERGTVADFVDRYEIDYPILLDPTLENLYRWSPQYGLPRHYFVDREGVVVREVIGEVPPEVMRETLEALRRDEG